MTNEQMLKEFHDAFNVQRSSVWVIDSEIEILARRLILEEYNEFIEPNQTAEEKLGELADLVYVCYGYADRFNTKILLLRPHEKELLFYVNHVDKSKDKYSKLIGLDGIVSHSYAIAKENGWNLPEAIRRKHEANMSKLGEDGKPILRSDGKILKGPNFKPATMEGLV